MTNRGSVVERANDRLTNVEISGNVESTFIKCETILDGPVGGKEFLRRRGFRGKQVAKNVDYLRVEGLTIFNSL